MAFDPDAFLAGGQPEVAKTFDPDAFLSGSPKSPIDSDIPAAPVEGEKVSDVVKKDKSLFDDVASVLSEFSSSANRSILETIDFLGVDAINQALDKVGSKKRIPSLADSARDNFGIGQKGFMEPGLARDVVQKTGEVLPAAIGMGGALRAGAQSLSPLAAQTEGMGAGVLRTMGQTTPAQDITLGALSGAGTALGGEAGEAIGGETGRKIGEVAGGVLSPVAGIVAQKPALAISKSITERVKNPSSFFRSNKKLIDEATDLPSKEFQSALDKRGIDFGSIADDVDSLPITSGNKTPSEIVDQIIIKKLKSGDQSDGLYNIKLGGSNGSKIIENPLGDEAVKQGFKKGDISSMNGANLGTKEEMVKMLGMKRQIHSDSSKGLNFRPSNVIGDNAMHRFNYVRGKALDLRKELDKVANKELSIDPRAIEGPNSGGYIKGRQIDARPVANSYNKGLSDLGVEIDSTSFPPKLDFSKSLISEDRTSQRVIRSVTNILAKDENPDALIAHQLKKQLDTMLDFNKKSAAGLTDSGKDFAMSIRRSLNDTIREVSPRYAQINDDLSLSLRSMQEFDKALGGVDAFSDNAKVAVGQTLRRLLTNVQSRAQLDDTLSSLDDTAAKLGGNFDSDIKRLIQFDNTLDSRFGATAKGSLQGSIDASLRSGPKAAIQDYALQKGAQKIEDLRGINDSNAFNVIQKILKGK